MELMGPKSSTVLYLFASENPQGLLKQTITTLRSSDTGDFLNKLSKEKCLT
jgi:hypothetical protein